MLTSMRVGLPGKLSVAFLALAGLLAVAAVVAIATALVVGGPTPPAAMASINTPFRSVDFKDLPPVLTFRASDGEELAYRRYQPQGEGEGVGEGGAKGSVTLIHGSSASSRSMHPLARALAAAGYRVFALDVRGHGQSGRKGHIDHIGQLEQDLADFVRTVQPPRPSTLVGFSAGGGFALRFAGSDYQSDFGSYLLLAPFISQDAANQRPQNGGWVSVGVPRLVGLSILNGIGIRAFNHLTVASFALDEGAKAFLTPDYDFNLAMNFRPERDYRATISRVSRPTAIVAGGADEAFLSDRLEEVVHSGGKDWPIDIVADTGHITLTLNPSAIEMIVRRIEGLRHGG